MFSTSRKLLSSITLFAFVFAFAMPLLVVIESANASPNVIFVRDHTTYYVCRCPDRPLWIIVDGEKQHVFHNITYNMQETWEYAKLGGDDHRCGTIEEEYEEC